MNFKFNVGDKVRILDGSKIDRYTGGWCMYEQIGKIFEIIEQNDYFDRPAYRLKGVYANYDERGLELVESDRCEIERVIFNNPATIVIWSDGSKTVVKCQKGDTYSKETGLALCIAKKFLGNNGSFNDVFKKWIPEEPKSESKEIDILGCLVNGFKRVD